MVRCSYSGPACRPAALCKTALKRDSAFLYVLLDEIKEKGYSRIPIYYGYNPTFVLGILIVKSLIGLNINGEIKTIRDHLTEKNIIIKTPSYVDTSTPISYML